MRSIASSSGAGSGDDRIFPNGVWALFYDGNNGIGFHYFEAVKQSLGLQWLKKKRLLKSSGSLIAIGSVTSLAIYSLLWFLSSFFPGVFLNKLFSFRRYLPRLGNVLECTSKL